MTLVQHRGNLAIQERGGDGANLRMAGGDLPGVIRDALAQDDRDDRAEVHAEIAVGLSHRYGEIRHYADQNLVDHQSLGPETDDLGQRQPADIAHLIGVSEEGLDVLGAEDGGQRKDRARQARFYAGIPGAVDVGIDDLRRVGQGMAGHAEALRCPRGPDCLKSAPGCLSGAYAQAAWGSSIASRRS